MASPIFDSLNQGLSIQLDDYVASATTDGKTYTSADRSDFLNRASKTLFNFFYDQFKEMVYSSQTPVNRDDNLTVALNRFRDFISLAGPTSTAGSLIALSGLTRFLEPLNVVNTVSLLQCRIIDRSQVPFVFTNHQRFKPTSANPICYVGDATNITVLPNSSDNQSKLFSVTYLKYPDFTCVANDSSEKIEWNATFYEDLKYLAVGFARLDNGDYQGFEAIKQAVFTMYKGNTQAFYDNKAVRRSVDNQ
ncbi:MAG TPA: hypothetical protein PKW36_11090 [bacterium]|nr:hypothetical protein [bacterium]